MPIYTLNQLANLTESKLVGKSDYEIEGIETLEAAGPKQAAFLENPVYEKQAFRSNAGVIFVKPSQKLEEGKNFLINENPSLAFQKAIELFIESPKSGFSGIHPTAVLHPDVKLGKEVTIGPRVVIDRGVIIGDFTVISAGCFIGAETIIGTHCFLYSNVTIRERCILKNRIVIQPGVVIGSCGFGYHSDKKGQHHYLKQLGGVMIEDDVEIGANSTIDRARFNMTRIARGTKIDNLVQIAHGVEVGEDNLIVAQAGIAGSSKTGRNVVLGGQAGMAGHIELSDRVILAGRAAATKSLEEAGTYLGAPAIPIKEAHITYAFLRNLPKLYKRVKDLEKKLNTQEEESKTSC